MTFSKNTGLLILALITFCNVHGQDVKDDLKVFLHPDKFYKKYFPHLRLKRVPVDTSYIKTYPNYLSVGAHVLSPALYLTISPNNFPGVNNAVLKFRTNVADILGFSASYRNVSAGFALLLNKGLQKHDDYAPSSYHTATIKYNSPIYSLQFKYLKLRGFTDINTDNLPYSQRTDMVTKEYNFDGVYNFHWKKYSYLAPLTFAQRQVKSHAGFLIKAGVYYKKLSSDYALIGQSKQAYYSGFNDSKGIQTFSIKVAPGVGGNLVFYKRIYLAAAVFPSLNLYFYRYFDSDNEVSGREHTFAFSVDGYASIGYQSQRIYAGLRYEIDGRKIGLDVLTMHLINSYLGLEFGYRFDAPRLIKRFYKKTMPPGM